ncbi:hypothetical protein OG589_02960 [Sphaerisporangium sp. NBC_01403]|uniref:hypothetical protein n=1 Tax=Sphaerisporangium sp. NBC_01403 TaxID=2903599 RepID=UPI003254C128
MIVFGESNPDRASLNVPRVGALVETGEVWMPWRLVDPFGMPVDPVEIFFRDLQARGRSVAILRSYGMDLLR